MKMVLRFRPFSFAQARAEYVCSPRPPRRLCVGAGALSPEKGGALRKQSTRGRRLGVATVLCGVVLGAPLLLLPHGSAHVVRLRTPSSLRAAPAGLGRTF